MYQIRERFGVESSFYSKMFHYLRYYNQNEILARLSTHDITQLILGSVRKTNL